VIPVPENNLIHRIFSEFFRQKFPADLKLVVIWLAAGILAIYFPLPYQTIIRFVLTLPVMIFIPGYSLISAFFPKEEDINLIERFALSIGISIAVVPLIGLGLNFTPWGIRLDPIVISLTLLTLVMILIAHFRRANIPSEERFRITFFPILKRMYQSFVAPEKTRTDRLLTIVLALVILIAIVTAIYVIAVPREGEQFTEFFILGENRTAANYPETIIQGQNYQMYVGVGNHEYRDISYTIETWMLRTEFDNVTNTSRIMAMDPQDRLFLSLSHNKTTIIPYNLTVKKTGYNRMEFLLFDTMVPEFHVTGNDRINASYRNLHLMFEVNEEVQEDQEEDSTENIIITS